MTDDQFTDAVMEQLFIRGFVCPHERELMVYVRTVRERIGCLPDLGDFLQPCIDIFGLENDLFDVKTGIASTTAGASEEWLAVHEAGHAIVGIRTCLKLTGVRFYNNGFPGEALFQDPEWQDSRDETLLRQLIAVDVAGNVAQLVHPGCYAPEGYLSRFYDDRTPGDRPTDFICADVRARHLATVMFGRAGKAPTSELIWRQRRAIVETAEAQAEQILRENLEVLGELAVQLRSGPMTGTAVRRIVEH